MNKIEWTKNVPTADGLYWKRLEPTDAAPRVVPVVLTADGPATDECGARLLIKHEQALWPEMEWAGPIYPPA